MITVSARDFNRDVSAAKRAASEGPVVITDRGRPVYVLLTIEDYRRLSEDGQDLVDRLSMDDEINFEPEPLRFHSKVADL